jgi:hypothetical protein
MIPGKYNMVCPQGSTFDTRLTWTIEGGPVNLFGYTARMQVREKHSSPKAILTLTTENGGISLQEEGIIDLYISDEDTSAVVAKNYVYDLEMINTNEVTRLLEGKFLVTPEVTR